METRQTMIEYMGVDLLIDYNYISGMKSSDYLVPNDDDEIEIEYIFAGDTDITPIFDSTMLKVVEEIIWGQI